MSEFETVRLDQARDWLEIAEKFAEPHWSNWSDWRREVSAKLAEFKDNGDGTISIPKPPRYMSLA